MYMAWEEKDVDEHSIVNARSNFIVFTKTLTIRCMKPCFHFYYKS